MVQLTKAPLLGRFQIQLFIAVAILTFIKGGIKRIEVLAVQSVLNHTHGFAETLEVYDFTHAQEFNRLAHIRFFDQAQDVFIGRTGFLLCCQILRQVGDGISLHLKFTGIKRNASGGGWPYADGVIHVVGGKAAFFYLFHGKIAGKLVYDCRNHFQMSQFFGAYIVLRNVPN